MLLANLCVAGMTGTIRELPSSWFWLGGATIFAATIYIGHCEAKVARVRAPTATTAAHPLSAPPARPGV